MARINIKIDASDFLNKSKVLTLKVLEGSRKGISVVADEILRLSQSEVPHDTGMLQNTGHVEEQVDGATVGYNTVYAARLHEHPEYNFQKGRKGKYLEDPIKHNLKLFNEILGRRIAIEVQV